MLATLDSDTVLVSTNYAHEEETLEWHKVRTVAGYERLQAKYRNQLDRDRNPEVHSVTFMWGMRFDQLDNPHYGYPRD